MLAIFCSSPLSNRHYSNIVSRFACNHQQVYSINNKSGIDLVRKPVSVPLYSQFCSLFFSEQEEASTVSNCAVIFRGTIINKEDIQNDFNLKHGFSGYNEILALYAMKVNGEAIPNKDFLRELRRVKGDFSFILVDSVVGTAYCYNSSNFLYLCSNTKNLSLAVCNCPFPPDLNDDIFSPYKLINVYPGELMFLSRSRNELQYQRFKLKESV